MQVERGDLARRAGDALGLDGHDPQRALLVVVEDRHEGQPGEHRGGHAEAAEGDEGALGDAAAPDQRNDDHADKQDDPGDQRPRPEHQAVDFELALDDFEAAGPQFGRGQDQAHAADDQQPRAAEEPQGGRLDGQFTVEQLRHVAPGEQRSERVDGGDVVEQLGLGGGEEAHRQPEGDQQPQCGAVGAGGPLLGPPALPGGAQVADLAGDDRPAPGRGEDEDHQQIGVDRPAVALQLLGEARDVVVAEELLVEGGAVQGVDRPVPRRGDDQQGDDAPPSLRLADARPHAAAQEQVGQPAAAAQGDRQRAFGQRGQAHRRAADDHPGHRAAVVGEEQREPTDRQPEHEGHVGDRAAAHDVAVEAGAKDGAGPEPRRAAEDEAAEQREQQRAERSLHRGGQPRRAGGRAEDGLRGVHHPVGQRRLLPAVLVVVVRRDEVARLDHLARGFGVDRLVHVEDADVVEEEDVEHEHGQAQPKLGAIMTSQRSDIHAADYSR